jgi:hypothetical protein
VNTEEILSELEQAIAGIDIRSIKPLPVDRWLASSTMQKSIRRGSKETAQRAALTLWHQDKRSLWMRLHVIALEDVGVASTDVIVKTLSVVNNTVWRSRVGDLKTALYLVCLLCDAVKIRLADELYSIATRDSDYQYARNCFANPDHRYLPDCVLDQSRPLPERIIALWYLVGTRRYPSDYLPMRTGTTEAAADVMRSLGAPVDLTENCIVALKKSPYPLALFTPLLWTELKKHPRSLVTWSDRYKPSVVYKGIPLVALDMFTRLGKTSYRKLQAAVPELKRFTTEQIGLCIFYIEGYCVDKRLTGIELNEYRKAGELADIQAAGLNIARYNQLIELLVVHADTLEAIRLQELKIYLHNQREQSGLKISHE